MIALLNGLKDLPGNGANTSFIDQKPTAETLHRLETVWLSVQLQDLDTPAESHGANSTTQRLKLVISHKKYKTLQVWWWKRDLSAHMKLDSTCCCAGFTKFWMFPSMFSRVSVFSRAVILSETPADTSWMFYSWQSYWFKLGALTPTEHPDVLRDSIFNLVHRGMKLVHVCYGSDQLLQTRY